MDLEYYRGVEKPWKLFGASESEWRNPDWQRANFLQDPHELAKHIDLTDTQISMIDETIKHGKPMRVSPYAVSLMRGEGRNPSSVDKQGNSTSDRVHELFIRYVKMPDQFMFGGGTADPLGDDESALGRIRQRYADRVAYFANRSARCDGFCNWCQRDRDLASSANGELGERPELGYIRDNVNIDEVLETGGDAFTLSDEQLEHDLKMLTEMRREDESGKAHPLNSIRIATGVLSTNPFAVTPEKLEIIGKYMKSSGNLDLPNIYAAVHLCALPELTEDVQRAVLMMKEQGLTVKNQQVLLKGVNDSFETTSRLSRYMHHMGFVPYYIFQCHRRAGCEGSIVPFNEGRYIAFELGGQEGGSSRVTYAVNLEGRGGKVVLTPDGMGVPDFRYKRVNTLRNSKTNETVEYEELMRVKESKFKDGIRAMSEFYGDPGIAKYDGDGIADGLPVMSSRSRKYRPSMLVVADAHPERVLYVTNITTPVPLDFEAKCDASGYVANGPMLGHPEQRFITNPAPLAGRYGLDK